MSGEKNLADIGLADINPDKQWLLLIYVPSDCNAFCLSALKSVNNTYVALGKEMPRVTPVLLTDGESSTDLNAHILVHKWQKQNMPSAAKTLLTPSNIVVVDPLNNLVLSHQIPSSSDALPAFGKAVLADMKKLLKYSRIG
mgnify:FL=1